MLVKNKKDEAGWARYNELITELVNLHVKSEEEYFCDLCGKEVDKDTLFDSSVLEGAIDLCPECADIVADSISENAEEFLQWVKSHPVKSKEE